MYRSRNILSKRLMKQPYFSFIHSYLNYANIAWASTNKSNLISLYCHQKHAIRIINDKDRFAHTKPLFKLAKALTVYEINLFQILSLMFMCKNRTVPFVFHNLYSLNPSSKYSLRTDNLRSIPLQSLANFQYIFCNLEYYPLSKNKLKEVIFSLNDATLCF